MLNKLRKWIIKLLKGVPYELYERIFVEFAAKKDAEHDRDLRKYKCAVREICRRSENTYYNWCCDYCECPCEKRNGWCEAFSPLKKMEVDTNA